MSRNIKIDRISPRSEKAPFKALPEKPLPPTQSIVDRSVQRSGLSYDSFVRLIVQSALSRLTIWSQADLDRLLMEETGLPVIVAEDPLTCVVRGSGMALEKMDKLGSIFTND